MPCPYKNRQERSFAALPSAERLRASGMTNSAGAMRRARHAVPLQESSREILRGAPFGGTPQGKRDDKQGGSDAAGTACRAPTRIVKRDPSRRSLRRNASGQAG